MTEKVRTYQQREMRMLSEFIAREYPTDRVLINQRLGVVSPSIEVEGLSPEEVRALGVFRRYADAIVIQPDRLIIIEAEIRPSPGVVSQLDLYERLLPTTPELADQRGKRIQKMILWVIPDPVLETIAREHDIVVRQYIPAWINDYIGSLDHRKRVATKMAI